MPVNSSKSLLRITASIAISIGTIAVLVSIAGTSSVFTLLDRVSLLPFLLAGALFLCSLALRAGRFAILATGERRFDANWLRLTAAHQFVFSVLPSGIGDLGFPVLASRMTNLRSEQAVSTIIVYRIQDIAGLAIMAAVGMLFLDWNQGWQAPVQIILVTLGVLTFGFLPNFARSAFGFLMKIFGKNPTSRTYMWLARAAGSVDIGNRFRAGTALLCLLGWAASGTSLWVLFDMLDVRLGVGELLLILAGLNVIGAFAAFTFAGLGISEGGLAALLVVLGFSTPEAASLALAIRPLALVNVLLCCTIVETLFRVFRRRATMPSTGKEEGRTAE